MILLLGHPNTTSIILTIMLKAVGECLQFLQNYGKAFINTNVKITQICIQLWFSAWARISLAAFTTRLLQA